MNFLNINEYLPLSSSEIMYKTIFINNPEFTLDKAKTVKHVSSLLDSLYNYKKDSSDSSYDPSREFMEENIIPVHYDVLVSKHLRYSPCFIHTHSFFEVIYVANGSCINEISDQGINMKKGDLCILAPGTSHAISVFNDDSIVFNLLIKASTFESAFFGTLRNKDIISSFFSRALYSPTSESYLLFPTGDDMIIQSLILEMHSEFNLSLSYSERMLNTLTTKLFITLLRSYEETVIVPNPLGNSLDTNIVNIMNHISNNYKSITLKDLSVFFNYSERQMSRILKDYIGKSFINIIQDIKTQKACELLRNADISINSIIDIVGYSNTSHFYRVFKKQYNMTPVEYRNKYIYPK